MGNFLFLFANNYGSLEKYVKENLGRDTNNLFLLSFLNLKGLN